MSLQTDRIFFLALSSNAELTTAIGGRLYNTAIPLPDEDAFNVPVPYVVLSFDGLNNTDTTKDSSYAGDSDTVTISALVTANTREELADLTQMIRDTVTDYFENATDDPEEAAVDGTLHLLSAEDYAMIPEDMTFQASRVDWDQFKPCYWQTLTYVCETMP